MPVTVCNTHRHRHRHHATCPSGRGFFAGGGPLAPSSLPLLKRCARMARLVVSSTVPYFIARASRLAASSSAWVGGAVPYLAARALRRSSSSTDIAWGCRDDCEALMLIMGCTWFSICAAAHLGFSTTIPTSFPVWTYLGQWNRSAGLDNTSRLPNRLGSSGSSSGCRAESLGAQLFLVSFGQVGSAKLGCSKLSLFLLGEWLPSGRGLWVGISVCVVHHQATSLTCAAGVGVGCCGAGLSVAGCAGSATGKLVVAFSVMAASRRSIKSCFLPSVDSPRFLHSSLSSC